MPTATGIPDRSEFGDLSKLSPGQLVSWIVQSHQARRAGAHQDVRLGTPETGLYSWATRKQLPKPGDRPISLFQQPLHSHEYGSFEGEIPEGSYGAGTVKKKDSGQVLINKIDDKGIHFTLAQGRYPERFALIKPRDPESKQYLLVNTTPTQAIPYQKVKYTKIPAEKAEEVLSKLTANDSVQAKIDGAASLTKLLKDRIEIVSYRASKSGTPLIHSERVYKGNQPKINIPPDLVGTILRGELYGVKDNKAIHPSELGGLLNASVGKSLTNQKEQGIELQNLIFDIQQQGKEKVSPDTPYPERLSSLKEVLGRISPAGSQTQRDLRLHPPEDVRGADAALKLWQTISQGKHPLTQEGVVIHPEQGKPSKIKQTEEHDVHVRDIFPGEGKYKNLGAGGFSYSHDPASPIAGKVGTGFSDDLRKELFSNPKDYLGRVAKVVSQEKLPSGALRAPAFHSFHEDYPLAKLAESPKDPVLTKLLLAKSMSDVGDYRTKHLILSSLLQERPNEFFVDSTLNDRYLGLTHRATGFRIHGPKEIIPMQMRLSSVLSPPGTRKAA